MSDQSNKSTDEKIAELEEIVRALSETRDQYAEAMAMIREAVETVSKPGALASREQTGVTPIGEARAIVDAIKTLAGPPPAEFPRQVKP